MKSTNYIIIYLEFIWDGELEGMKASLSKPTCRTHSDFRIFQLTRKRKPGDYVCWNPALKTRQNLKSNISQEQAITDRFQWMKKHLLKSHTKHPFKKLKLSNSRNTSVTSKSKLKIEKKKYHSNFIFILHSSSFHFHAICICLTPVLLTGEQDKYFPEWKLLLSSLETTR